MDARLTRLILGLLILAAQFLEPATRWLSWGIVGLLLFEGVTGVRVTEEAIRSVRLRLGRSAGR